MHRGVIGKLNWDEVLVPVLVKRVKIVPERMVDGTVGPLRQALGLGVEGGGSP